MTCLNRFPFPKKSPTNSSAGSVVWSPLGVFFKQLETERKEKDLAMNLLFILFRGWDLDLYFYSFKMPLFEILFLFFFFFF